MRKGKVLSIILTLFFVFTMGLTAEGQNEANADGSVKYPKGVLDFVAPGGAGGGWDLTIRTTAKNPERHHVW